MIDSGHKLCRTCLKAICPPRAKHLASDAQLEQLRELGVRADESTTKDDVKRLKHIAWIRSLGFAISEEAMADAVGQLSDWIIRPTTIPVVGIAWDEDRQRAARKCKVGDEITLRREPSNETDRNAIQVWRSGWLGEALLGYVGSDDAEELAERMDAGDEIISRVCKLTEFAGKMSDHDRGIIIKIEHRPGRESRYRPRS